MSFAFTGKILHVDLTARTSWVEPLPDEWRSKWIGCRGINAYLLWRDCRPGIDPLGPENPLIFGLGPLTGTHAPTSGRHAVTCKSPATGFYLKSSAGGHWGLHAKLSGYDHIVVHGAAAAPTYLWLHDNVVEFRDATAVWGHDVRQSDALIKKQLGDDQVQVACIGQAGENLVSCAAIMYSVYNAAGRAGAGAVMGSKRLKAIAVKGSGSVVVADPKAYNEAVFAAREAIANQSGAAGLSMYGTAVGIPLHLERRTLPSFNFQHGIIENGYNLSGQWLTASPYLKRPFACATCPIACHRFTAITSGPHAGCYSGGPEYETNSALGSGCGTADMEVIIKANELSNLYGLDTISVGAMIQWAMESYQRGVISREEADDLDLGWGNSDTILTLIKKIALREGFGNLLADGIKRASEKVGKDSWKWAVQVKGLEQSRNENRFSHSYGLAFAVNPRGPDHLMTECIAERGGSVEGRALIKKITGDVKYATSFIVDKRAEIVRYHEDIYCATEAVGCCVFMSTAQYGLHPENLAELFSTATGIPMTGDRLMEAGRRTVTLEKCFNVREGASRKDDTLAYRTLYEKMPDREEIDPTPYPEKLERMLNEYYTLHGWDLATSWPTRETLTSLGLADVADELGAMGRLPTQGGG